MTNQSNNYLLSILDDVTRVVLTATADNANTTVSYSVNNIGFNSVVSGDPFTIDPLPTTAAVITIRLEALDVNLRSADYTVNIVRVNTAPTISGIPQQPIRLLEGLSAELDVGISDANADDNFNVRIDTSDSRIATATIIATIGTTRTLKVRGVGAGDAMITIMVDDGKGVANSSASAVFEVQVAANTTPTITLMPSSIQPLSANSTAQIVVSVADNNFNLDDIVTLEAMSSSQTIVSVTPERVPNIMMNMDRNFILNAERAGEATITFTATDIGGLSNSETVLVNVNPLASTIKIRIKVFLEGPLQ